MKLIRIVFFLLLAVSALEACPVCFSAKGESRFAFYITTIFMSLTPLAMVGFFSYWMVKRSRALESQNKD